MMCKVWLPDEEFKIIYIERNQMFDVHYHCKGIKDLYREIISI